MKLDIHERDIEPDLCRLCAACCRITFRLQNTHTRYRKFLRRIGFNLLPPPAEGKEDCCPGKHTAVLDMGYCRNLEIETREDGPHYRCRIYVSEDLPELCREFNCVSWAKATDHYTEKNKLLWTAQNALDRLREQKRK